MERDPRPVDVRLMPDIFISICRCVKDDFEERYQACLEEPFEDHSIELDRMEEDLDAMRALLPAIASETTEIEIKKLIAEFEDKIAEVA